ncbi:MAG: thioesterase family protein [Chloroflexota bacterium]
MTSSEGLSLYNDVVRPEWIDYNGHMSEAFYVLAFGFATDAFYDHVGLDATYRDQSSCSIYTVEAHISYLRELAVGTHLLFTTLVLGYDQKRLHLFHRLYNAEADYLAATIELMVLHVDQAQQCTVPFPEHVISRLEKIYAEHQKLSRPTQAGRQIGL